MLKALSTIGNLCILGLVLWAFLNDRPFPSIDQPGFWLVSGVAANAILNLAFAFKRSAGNDNENILALWLRVKRAELHKAAKHLD